MTSTSYFEKESQGGSDEKATSSPVVGETGQATAGSRESVQEVHLSSEAEVSLHDGRNDGQY